MNPLDNSEVIMHELLPLILKCYQNKRFILKIQWGSKITSANLTSPVKISQKILHQLCIPRMFPLTSVKTATSSETVSAGGMQLTFCWHLFVRCGEDGERSGLKQPPKLKAMLHVVHTRGLQNSRGNCTHEKAVHGAQFLFCTRINLSFNSIFLWTFWSVLPKSLSWSNRGTQ